MGMANTPAIRSKQAARATLKGSRSLLCTGNLLTFVPSRSFSSIFCVTDLATRSTWSVLSSCRCLSLSWPNDLYTSSYRLREDGIHELTNIPDEFQIPTFRRLFLLSEIGNFAPEEYEQYLSSMGEFSDYYNTIDTAAEEAEKRGHARGLKMSAEPCEGKAFASALLDFIQQSAGFVQESGGLLFCRGEFLPLERKNQVKI